MARRSRFQVTHVSTEAVISHPRGPLPSNSWSSCRVRRCHAGPAADHQYPTPHHLLRSSTCSPASGGRLAVPMGLRGDMTMIDNLSAGGFDPGAPSHTVSTTSGSRR